MLADEINLGYHDIDNVIIEKINGKNVSSMRDVVDSFEKNTGLYHVIEDDKGNQIILRKDKVDKYSSRILQTYHINSDRSDDLVLKSGK